MKRFLITSLALIALALPLTNCAEIQKVGDLFTSATSGKVSPESVGIAVRAFDGVEVTAKNYLLLRRCTGSNGPICRDPAATPTIIAVIKSGRIARNNLQSFLRTHPDGLGAQGVLDALKTATGTIQDVLIRYHAT